MKFVAPIFAMLGEHRNSAFGKDLGVFQNFR